jgi:hypothetical protein
MNISPTFEQEVTYLRNEFINGNLTMREVMESIDLGPEATLDDYREVFDDLFS